MTKKLKTEELKKLVKEVRFNTEGFVYGPDVIDIRKDDGKCTVTITSLFHYIEEEYTITQDRWDSLIDALYDDIQINKWSHNYTSSEWVVCDGEDWELQISVEGGRRRIYRGSSVYPDNWDDFESIMKSFVKEH